VNGRSPFSPLQASIPEPVVPSPCINICTMDTSTGLCLGCLRTIDEIAVWAGSSNPQKREILQAIAVRRQKAAK
jgi:predicted Fe-S protein YdhL (DUF1289 family)